MPNKNSYLAACFDEATRSALNELQDALEEHLQSEGYSFDRMSLQVLHLTFLFAGERLRQLSGEQLRTCHTEVTVAIRQSGLGCKPSVIKISGICVFPPGKSNLIVARFDVPRDLRELEQVVARSARAAGISVPSSSRAGELEVEEGDENDWVPHVTLGKVRASRDAVQGAGMRAADRVWQMCGCGTDEGVGPFAPRHGLLNALLAAPLDGLVLCGEQPKQAWIDWKHTLQFSRPS